MATNTKEIKRRIQSIQNTRQITKAMQLVATVKMRKAQDATLATRAYSDKAWSLIRSLSSGVDRSLHPLLTVRPVKKACVIIVSPDKGLCGSLNANVMKASASLFEQLSTDDISFDVLAIGKRIRQYAVNRGHSLVAEFSGFDRSFEQKDILPVAEIAIKGFVDGTYDSVHLIYTDFKSTLIQEVSSRQLLPLMEDSKAGELGDLDDDRVAGNSADSASSESSEPVAEYEFEPDAKSLLHAMLPRLTEMQLYQAVLESLASEHSARMVAMKNASESAGELIDELNLEFNQARQGGITQEISEISAGMAALE